ncbi:hypothetical protein [Reyranella sp.]|uniref:hypothetical protein n=1 Tax=Reyranella sp. TaxID=1929291 RepID=UPI003BA89120
MLNVKWLVAAAFVASTTAACTGETGYPGTYGYPSTAYNSGYYNNGRYVAPANTAYYTTGSSYAYNRSPNASYYDSYNAPQRTSRYGARGDYDRDGVPNRYDRDANGDGVSDRYQR